MPSKAIAPTPPPTHPSAIAVLEHILSQAIRAGATDIHISPTPTGSWVRVRIDGSLEELTSTPPLPHPALAARIKILANLRIDQHFIAQDGRFAYSLNAKQVFDIRVSLTPAYYGENIVLRLLTRQAEPTPLHDLGCTSEQQSILNTALAQDNGLILTTGPTGSGKTTLLYALLARIDTRSRAVVTLEDPIEYSIPYINQIPVGAERGLSFSHGLRSILRQDPDIIMIGEIRDTETATLAIHAALTGHLVLSSLHTRNAVGVIPRLVDMGIAPYLLAATLQLIIATRLARKLCSNCRYSYTPPAMVRDHLETAMGSLPSRPPQFCTSTGCDNCRHTGIAGRIGIFETCTVTDAVRTELLSVRDGHATPSAALHSHIRTLATDAAYKASAGTISPQEALHISSTAL